eukprot:5661662-Pleurochrysis_carterae.AAC.4
MDTTEIISDTATVDPRSNLRSYAYSVKIRHSYDFTNGEISDAGGVKNERVPSQPASRRGRSRPAAQRWRPTLRSLAF